MRYLTLFSRPTVFTDTPTEQLITHSGAIPGFSTKVAFLPTDKLGIVLLANADEKAAANEVIMYRIIEDVLRLRRVDRIISTDAQ